MAGRAVPRVRRQARRPKISLATLALCFAGFAGVAHALDVAEYREDGRCRAVALSGDIRPDEGKSAAQRIVDTAERCGTTTVIVRAMPGGSVADAADIGAVIRAREYATVMLPDSVCASACGLVYLAGAQRFWRPGGRFIIHRPDIRRTFKTPAEETQAYEDLRARLARYASAMGGNPDYVDAMYAVRPGSHEQLGERDLTRLGLVTVVGSPFAGR